MSDDRVSDERPPGSGDSTTGRWSRIGFQATIRLDPESGRGRILSQAKAAILGGGGTVMAWVEGYLAHDPACAGGAKRLSLPVAQSVLFAYSRLGVDFAAHLEGEFAAAILDLRAGLCVLARSAGGSVPLFYQRTGAEVSFSTSLGQLVRESEAAWDGHWFFQALSGIEPDLSRTPVAGAKRVLPGHSTVLTAGAERSRRWWRPEEIEPRHPSLAGAAEEFLGIWRQVTEDVVETGDRIAVAMSGGLDSGGVLLVASSLGRSARIAAVTADLHSDSGEEQVEFAGAGEVVRHTGAGWIPLAVTGRTRARGWPVGLDAPMASFFMVPRLDDLVSICSPDVVLTGFGGDRLFGGGLPVPHLSRSRRILGEVSSRLVPRRLRTFRRRTIERGVLVRRLESCLRLLSAPRRDAYRRIALERLRDAVSTRGFDRKARQVELLIAPRGDLPALEAQFTSAATRGWRVRHPLVDSRLARFVAALPVDVLVDSTRDAGSKLLMRRALEPLAPAAWLQQTKRPFDPEKWRPAAGTGEAGDRPGPPRRLAALGFCENSDTLEELRVKVAGLAPALRALEALAASCQIYRMEWDE